jgi:hypothetical protein
MEPGAGAVRPGYKPPLVEDLFKVSDTFDTILNKYPGARGLSDEIRLLARKHPFEEVLRRLTADDSPVRRPAMQIPLYLQELIGEVGVHYVLSGATRFQTMLIRILRSRFRSVLFLTVNYDLFVENAIQTIVDHRINAMDSYVWPMEPGQWGLVKLHGSVNWGRPLRIPRPDAAGVWQDALGQVGPRLEVIEDDFRYLTGHQDDARAGSVFLYPALSIPIAGKTDFVCPERYLGFAGDVVTRATHLLVAGFSGLDTHVLDRFVRPMRALTDFRIVNGNRANGEKTLRLFAEKNPTFNRASDPVVFDGGFSGFVGHGGLNAFLGVEM